MISKNEAKLIRSLKQKKFRKQEERFLVEGEKIVKELLASDLKTELLFTTKNEQPGLPAHKIRVIGEKEMKEISQLKTPSSFLALARIPEFSLEPKKLTDQLTLALDKVNDPGNLGTIIRIADHFGIGNILCSADSVDVFNPKTVQATMGSIFRVKVHYVDLPQQLEDLKNENMEVHASTMNGSSIYQTKSLKNGIILMGSESHGLSEELLSQATQQLTIPSFGGAESLNVAVATGLICSEFRRRNVQ